jgi:hypothetical protein
MRALKGKARRGRPRQQRDAQDRGTPEIQALRRRLAAGGDAALTEYPLGMLRLRQMIDGDQHEAGCHYAFLYRQAVGRVQVSCNHLQAQSFVQQTQPCKPGSSRPNSRFGSMAKIWAAAIAAIGVLLSGLGALIAAILKASAQ